MFVDVLEEFMSRQILAALDDFGKLTVLHIDDMLFTTLATEMELDYCSGDFYMFITQGSEAIGVVLTRIFFVTNADVSSIEQSHQGGKHLFSRQASVRQIVGDSFAQLRKALAKRDDTVVFGFVSY